MKFVASVKKKGGNPPGPTPGGGSGGGGISPGPAPNPGNPQTPAKDNNIDKGTKGEQEIKFIDVKDNSWAKEAIMYVAKKGIFKGVSSDRFNPNGNVDRAMFITALARYFKGEGKSAVTFKETALLKVWSRTMFALTCLSWHRSSIVTTRRTKLSAAIKKRTVLVWWRCMLTYWKRG